MGCDWDVERDVIWDVWSGTAAVERDVIWDVPAMGGGVVAGGLVGSGVATCACVTVPVCIPATRLVYRRNVPARILSATHYLSKPVGLHHHPIRYHSLPAY